MQQEDVDRRVREFYAHGWQEDERLVTFTPAGAVEFLRVQELVRQHLAHGSRVLDVGGATGVHARWLAADGHTVTLIDPVPEQVAVAARIDGVCALVGDARALPFPDHSFDAALLFGPLYHLVARGDRLGALREALRVVSPGGLVMASGLSRLAAAAFRMTSPAWDRGEDGLLDLVRDGAPLPDLRGFPGAHFHTCGELESELTEAGLTGATTVGVEGFAVAVEYLRGADPEIATAMLTLARRLGEVPGAKDTSGHLMGIATAP